MYRFFKKVFASAEVLLLSLAFTIAQPSTNGLTTIRVLFVGNSYKVMKTRTFAQPVYSTARNTADASSRIDSESE
jgi:hypothetical protein